MKKKILFVMNNLGCGGAEKSLVTLLGNIDYSSYEVSLFLFSPKGAFMDLLPGEIKLYTAGEYWELLNSPLKKSITGLFHIHRYDMVLARVIQAAVCRRYKNRAVMEQKLWRYIRCAFDRLEDEYDVVIGYMEKNPIYFSVDKVRAKKKIGWIHASYENLGVEPKLERKYFKKLDHIITVSEQSAGELRCMFPESAGKVLVIGNIISPEMIKGLSCEKVRLQNHGKHKIVTVARLNFPKGIDLAVDACAKLVNDGYDVSWHVIGEGEQRPELENRIQQLGLDGRFILEGEKANPYPYIGQADIYVQPSRTEAFGIAIAEARVLSRPVVSTNFPAASEQIRDMVDGILVNIDAGAIYEGIRYLLDNPQIRNEFAQKQSKLNISNREEITKLYRIIEK